MFPGENNLVDFISKSIVTFFQCFLCDPEHFRDKTHFKHPFSKLFSTFHFWTFLKMSIFQNRSDFYKRKLPIIDIISKIT